MLLQSPMHRIRIIILQRDEDAVTETLGQMGVVELARTQEEGVDTRQKQANRRIEKCQTLKKRLTSLMKWFGVEIPETTGEEEVRDFSLNDVSNLIDQVEKESEPIGKKLDKLEEKRETVQATMDDIAPYRDLQVSPDDLAETSFLHVTAGDMPIKQIPAARSELPGDAILAPIGPGEASEGAQLQRVLALSSRRSRFALGTILEEHQFEEQSLPTNYEASPAAIYNQAKEKRDELTEKIEELQEPLLQIGKSHGEEFEAAYKKVVRELQISRASQNYGSTWSTIVINGWCPKKKLPELKEKINDVTDGSAIVESRSATEQEIEKGEVPSYCELPDFLSPFQMLVQGFGVAGYREVEPTLMFAVSFLLMFGVMFGDLGHGLCLLAGGIALRQMSERNTLRQLGYVIAAAGGSAALFGTFFQGSVFGFSLNELGWPYTFAIEPINLSVEGGTGEAGAEVLRYMTLAVGLGITLISLGIILNIFSRLRAGEYEQGLLGRFGLAGGIFYWGTLALAIKLLVTHEWSPLDTWLVVSVIGLPLLVLAFQEPIYALLTGRSKLWEENPVFGIFEGVLEIVETIMTFVANTFSFLRVAAFALSHVALCFTIFILQGLVMELPGGPLWSALIFVLGTAVVIGLEGLVVAIQIFRLEYYEFFTKFFRGEGHKFRPFQLGEQ